MMTKRIKKAAILVFAGFMAISLPGVGSTALGAPSNRETRAKEETWGRVFLSAGPKISLSYDREGEVLETKGLNQDGRKLLEGAGSFAGMDCDTAVRRLVKRMNDKGWFHKDRNERELVIESEKGSVYPRADFMKEIEEAAWKAVEKNSIDIIITLKDNGKQSEQLYIGKNEAKEIVIRELGLKENELTYKECDLDDGVYEWEFLVNGRKLEVDVNAATGKIVNVDWDDDAGVWDDDRHDDDRDDRHDDDRDDRHDDDRDDWYDDDRDDWYDDDRDDRHDDDRDDRYDDDRDDRHDDDRDDRYDDDRDDRHDDDRDDRHDDDRDDRYDD